MRTKGGSLLCLLDLRDECPCSLLSEISVLEGQAVRRFTEIPQITCNLSFDLVEYRKYIEKVGLIDS